jgi:hypothetical protein
VFPNTRTRLMSEFSFSPRQRAGSTKASNCPNFHFAIVHAHLNVINVSGPAVASSRCRDVLREVSHRLAITLNVAATRIS